MTLGAWVRANRDSLTAAHRKAIALPRGYATGSVRMPFEDGDRKQFFNDVRGAHLAERAEDAPVIAEPLSKLVSTQGTVQLQRLRDHIDDDELTPIGTRKASGMIADLPVVVRLGGRDYILDGHHRLTAAWCKGERAAGVRLIDLDKQGWKPKG